VLFWKSNGLNGFRIDKQLGEKNYKYERKDYIPHVTLLIERNSEIETVPAIILSLEWIDLNILLKRKY